MSTRRRRATRRGSFPPPVAAPPLPRRRPVALTLVLLTLLGQIVLALTVGILCLIEGPADASSQVGIGGTLAGLVTVGAIYLLMALVIVLASWRMLRRSALAGFALLGTEVLYLVISFVVLPIVGVLVAGTALLVLLLLLVGPGVRSYLRPAI